LTLAKGLYTEAKLTDWIFPHLTPLRFTIISGMDLGHTACLATRLRDIAAGEKEDHIAMLHSFLDQMRNQGVSAHPWFPAFIHFTV
jgi:hypothetical protein